jgi:hypothetical protein
MKFFHDDTDLLLLSQTKRQIGRLGVEIVDRSQVAAVVLDARERSAAQLARSVDPMDGLVLGQGALVTELLSAGLAGEDVLRGRRTTQGVLRTTGLIFFWGGGGREGG